MARVTVRDTGFNEFVGALRLINGYTISAGIQAEDANTVHKPSGLPMALISAIHEFGHPAVNIPARPHIRPTFDENHKRYSKEIVRASEKALERRTSPDPAYKKIAKGMRDDIEKRMRAGIAGEVGAGGGLLSIGKIRTLIDTEDYVNHIKGKAER